MRANLVKKSKMHFHVSKWLLLPSHCQNQEGIFLRFLLWEHSRTPGSKTVKSVSVFPWGWTPWISQLSDFSPLNLQQFFNYRSVFLLWNLFLWWLLLGGSSLPCDISFMTDLKRIGHFWFVELLLTRMEL